MCTLIVGRDVLGRGTLILAANRDENPQRPSEPPRVLSERPRVVGGRDRVAGGTWLAIREQRVAIAMLNRRDTAGSQSPDETLRSRGRLAIDVATAGTTGAGSDDLSHAMLATVRHAVREDRYGPFSIACLIPESPWVLSHDPGATPWVRELDRGWHVLTHADLDDASEPRTARLIGSLRDWAPPNQAEAEHGLTERLSLHGEAPVCIHAGPMVTVSSSIVTLGSETPRYLHFEGRPCERAPADHSALLLGAASLGRRGH